MFARAVPYEIVAIGASAGGVKALLTVLAALPAGFPVPVVIVQHLDPHHDTVLAELLDRRSRLRVKLAEDGEPAEPGTAYIAPPDRHLLIGPGGELRLSERDKVRFVRPSADLLFESVALVCGAAALVCVLTGTGFDGSAGARAVSSRGGTVIAEDPSTAEFKGMPQAVVNAVAVDLTLPLEGIAAALVALIEGTRSL
ncbi:chemotaxis protein CheB [Amycolatopsis keratiniphila]|uniref:protein-glutamate methylesterase n=1 Tax=Amycolatopsis keratiniphila TaxID=129921 RepID=R4T3R1_9PSEU|nr:chemotaxis protein CheB [Amycolatopsis keratiniphila]AGM10244.1 two-component system, chemotaxis family, response regulator CheB [Amycolatopsis keratiniphila]